MKDNFFKDLNMMSRIGICSGFLIAGGSAAYGVHQTVKFVKKKTFARTNLSIQAFEGASTSDERFPCKLNDKLEAAEVSIEGLKNNCVRCTYLDEMPMFAVGHVAEKIAYGFLILLAIFTVKNTVETYKHNKGAPPSPPSSGSSKTT